jgi:phospholipid/cholesterol/gamma-HCH transport system substrate-binding protein
VSLRLLLDPDAVKYIPANVDAKILASTAFGANYVDLTSPSNPSRQRIAAGAVLRSSNVSTEVNTVFQNLVGVLNRIDFAKLNAVLPPGSRLRSLRWRRMCPGRSPDRRPACDHS